MNQPLPDDLQDLISMKINGRHTVTKLTELIESAKAATPGPWSYAFPYVRTDRTGWKVANVASTMGDANLEADNAKFIASANPTTILELCALLEKAEDALEYPFDTVVLNERTVSTKAKEALAAIKQWK